MKKILLLIFLIFTPAILLTSCNKTQYYECGDFLYTIIEENGEKMAGIINLTDYASENKEVIIMLEYLDEYKVYGLYDKGRKQDNGRIRCLSTAKIYVFHNYINSFDASAGEKAFFMGNGITDRVLNGKSDCKCYVPSNVKISNEENNVITYKFSSLICYANVSYYVDDSIYWIDDYDESLIKYPPTEPVKVGYTFDGWYKDSEYNEKWDFSKDMVPKKNLVRISGNVFYDGTECNTEYTYYYKETKLFAKFTCN